MHPLAHWQPRGRTGHEVARHRCPSQEVGNVSAMRLLLEVDAEGYELLAGFVSLLRSGLERPAAMFQVLRFAFSDTRTYAFWAGLCAAWLCRIEW